MSDKRCLTAEELKKLGTPRSERALAAIEANDKETAKKEVQGMFNEFLSMHNILRDWIAALYTHIYRKEGDEALYEANHVACSFWLKDLIELYPKAEPRRKAQLLAAGFRGHLVPLKVEEDDEKFTITMLPCGSGGKLHTDGGYDPPRNLAKVDKPQPQTFQKGQFPIYCTHCAFQEIIPIEALGHPLFITDPPEADKIGIENCKVYIYKDPKDIPAKFYERLGKKKP
ncbi:MAG: hypothetical protein V1930_01275 [Pseudomonadota bacterium]